MSKANKVVLIIPGAREHVSSNAYQDIGIQFEEKSIKPLYIQPNWKFKSISEQLKDTLNKIHSSINENDEIYLLGFSKGAMFALISASQIKVKHLILCSMSFFKEEVPHLGILLKLFTKKIIYGGEVPFSYPQLAYSSEVSFVYGEKELRSIPKTIIESRGKVFNSNVEIIAHNSGHNISHAGYQSAINKIITGL